jgi:uncharacterized membrane protein YfcA
MWSDPAIAAALQPATLGLLWLGGFIGAVASGGAGFAFALTASAIWLHVLDPLHATLLIVASSALMQFGTVWPLRHHLNGRRLLPFIIGGLIGIPFGVTMLAHTDPSRLKMALGAFLAVFGLYALAAPRLPVVGRGGRPLDSVVGFIGGVLGGLGGYSGVLPTIWTQLRGWPKFEARAVYQPFIIVVQLVTLAMVGFVALDRTGVVLLIAVLPALLAGGVVGWQLYGRLDERRFRQFLAVLLVLSGLTLLW